MSSSQKRKQAKHLFEVFHQYEPIKVGEFGRGFCIPREVLYVGDATKMFYTSDKLNPETSEDEGWISYYHDHKKGVRMYVTDETRKGEWRRVPKWIWGADALVRLGDCDGFTYVDFDGNIKEAEATGVKPEWYCTSSGKALLVIQSKRKVLAIVWGGKLDVEDRGVVG